MRRALGFKLDARARYCRSWSPTSTPPARRRSPRAGDRLGTAAPGRGTDQLGAPARRRPRVRHLPQDDRPGHRDPRPRLSSRAARPRPTPYLWSPTDVSAPAAGDAAAAAAAAGGDLRGAVRSASRCRGMRIGEAIALDRRRCRPRRAGCSPSGRRSSATPGWSRCTPAPPTRWPRYAAAATGSARSPRSDTFFVSSVGTALRDEGVHRHVQPAHHRARAAHRDRPTPHSRSSAQLRRAHPDRLAPRRGRHRSAAWRCCRPTSGTSTRPAPTGICPPHPS